MLGLGPAFYFLKGLGEGFGEGARALGPWPPIFYLQWVEPKVRPLPKVTYPMSMG